MLSARNYIFLAALLMCTASLSAQTVSFSELNAYVQNARIGLVDEFFDRFNGKTTHPDLPATKADSRAKNLMMLFNLAQFTSQSDPRFAQAAEMMQTVTDKKVSISYADSTWAALAHCSGQLNGKSVKFDLYLTVQSRGDSMYKWVISRAEGKIFSIAPRDTSSNIMLMPDDHETNFMSLKRMTDEQPQNDSLFLASGYRYDPTSAFACLVHSGMLKIDHVENLEFIFLQVPGYTFRIKYFDRQNGNAGWLISSFSRADDEQKAAFIRSLRPSCRQSNYGSKDDEQKAAEQKAAEKARADADFKETFQRLRDMKVHQVIDYISFIQSSSDSLQQHYISRLQAIFAPDAKVNVRKGKKVQALAVSEFTNKLANRKYKSISLDSLQVPLWDDSLLTLDPSVHEVEVQSVMRPLSAASSNAADSTSSTILMKTLLYREETEDGTEWLLLLGDLSLTVK